jgi:hypothetical protein
MRVEWCSLGLFPSEERQASDRLQQPTPAQSQYMWTLKWMRPESACKSAAELVTNKTLELLRYSAHFSGLC